MRWAVAGTLACQSRRAAPVAVLTIEGATVRPTHGGVTSGRRPPSIAAASRHMRHAASFAPGTKKSDRMAGAEDSLARPQAAREVGAEGIRRWRRRGRAQDRRVDSGGPRRRVGRIGRRACHRSPDSAWQGRLLHVIDRARGCARIRGHRGGLHIGDLPSVATDVVGRVRVSARSGNGQALFVVIAPQTAVNAYLAGAARSEVTDVNGDTVTYKTHPGRAPASRPARTRKLLAVGWHR